MKYNMNNASHEVELTIDEVNLTDGSPVKISIDIGAGHPSDIDELIASYKCIDHENFAMGGTDGGKFEQASQILDAIAISEVSHSNDLKNIALIWDHDFPIMVQGDTAGHSRWALFTALVHTIIYTYLNGESILGAPPITAKMRKNLEHKATLLLNLSATHNLGVGGFFPTTYPEVHEEMDRIAPNWGTGAL